MLSGLVLQSVEFLTQNALKLTYVHLKIQKISRVCTSGPPRYKGKKGKRRRIVESYPVTLFKKVGAYGKNEMKRGRGGEGRKKEEAK
jgi:hypothetical protein